MREHNCLRLTTRQWVLPPRGDVWDEYSTCLILAPALGTFAWWLDILVSSYSHERRHELTSASIAFRLILMLMEVARISLPYLHHFLIGVEDLYPKHSKAVVKLCNSFIGKLSLSSHVLKKFSTKTRRKRLVEGVCVKTYLMDSAVEPATIFFSELSRHFVTIISMTALRNISAPITSPNTQVLKSCKTWGLPLAMSGLAYSAASSKLPVISQVRNRATISGWSSVRVTCIANISPLIVKYWLRKAIWLYAYRVGSTTLPALITSSSEEIRMLAYQVFCDEELFCFSTLTHDDLERFCSECIPVEC